MYSYLLVTLIIFGFINGSHQWFIGGACQFGFYREDNIGPCAYEGLTCAHCQPRLFVRLFPIFFSRKVSYNGCRSVVKNGKTVKLSCAVCNLERIPRCYHFPNDLPRNCEFR
ncbi:uncharacterized protein LOC128999441 [Macrosteles quadrilineatus]|uniref:uncharacterized protein LOC128982075 n=1 Tax=Macrosteles quadrilineatus TaxID=74068 RepID=UPI0023E0AB4A|nr:uncharacterized protein LOC128982075 [Macrosteles quadrilineatus]XP_054281940.1 uncharacterized protein LOC128999441 [Macrosteles quadrilineatus]